MMLKLILAQGDFFKRAKNVKLLKTQSVTDSMTYEFWYILKSAHRRKKLLEQKSFKIETSFSCDIK